MKDPLKLKALKGQFSEGQKTMGRGFELTAAERQQLLDEDPKCSEVIFPLFHGQDLNSMPIMKPHRWVVYFRDWPAEKARRYAPAFRRLEELVKPYRDSLTGQIHQDCFWKLWDLRPGLMREFDKKSHVLAIARVTKYLCVSRVTTQAVYNDEVKVLFFDGFRELAVLQSTLHGIWARWRAGTLGAATLRYSTTATLETWPMPRLPDMLEDVGLRYSMLRDEIRLRESIGLTDVYNRFHDPADTSDFIDSLRHLHREMDRAVLNAFDWHDLDIDLDFRAVPTLPESDRVRLTVSERMRTELLRRVSELNHRQYAEEQVSGARRTSSSLGRAPKHRASDAQLDLEVRPAPTQAKKPL